MTETDPLKLLYRRLRDNVTQGVAGDVMQMPPSWGELLTAFHEAAFPDGDDDTTTVTSGKGAAARTQYAAGWDDGYAEGHAEGYRAAVLRFADRGDVNTAAERLEADRALAAEVRARILAILDDLEAQDLAKAGQYEPRHEQWQKCAYAAHRLRQAKQLIIKGGKQ